MLPIAALLRDLQALLGSAGVVAGDHARQTYAADASMIVAQTPDLVALPRSSDQAAQCVRLANDHGVPVIARGAGTGIAGGAVAHRGGLVISTARLDQIEAIELRDRRALVGAGVVNGELNAHLAPLGYQFAPDPSSQRASTIGGNLATNAGGPHCLKYGVTSNHLLAVELVRPDGSRLWSGHGHPDSPGGDLTGLVVGSEGTFGLVTRAVVRLTPLPEAVRVVLALFPDVLSATRAVSRIIAAGLLPTSLEVMDHNAIKAVNGAYRLGLPEADGTTALIVEVDGVSDGLDEALEAVLAQCRAEGAFDLRPARSAEEQARVWMARKSVAGAIGRLAPAYYLVDTVVPRTRLAAMMGHVERLRHELDLEVCNVFHAGDGNLHPLVLYDPRNPEQTARAHHLAEEVLRLSLAEGGVISGEHGIGLEKQNFLPLLFRPPELALQAAIWQVFNPDGQFNPAKVFPLDQNPLQLAAARHARLLAATGPAPSAPPAPALLAELHTLLDEAGVLVRPNGALYLCPATTADAAAAIRCVTAAGHQIAYAPSDCAHVVQISPERLTGVLRYEPDDQTIGVEAGLTIAALQALLAANGQFFPVTVPNPEQTTIGQLVTEGWADPLQLGYGALRDLVLGLDLIEADGTPVRLGAQVVKNVTGYDLLKYLVGAGGRGGWIAAVRLRIFPRPPQQATLVLTVVTRSEGLSLGERIASSRLLPVACELFRSAEGQLRLLVQVAGSPAHVARHAHELASFSPRPIEHLSGEAEAALWREIAELGAEAAGYACLRLSGRASHLADRLRGIEALAKADALGLRWSARLIGGAISLKLRAEPDLRAAWRAALATPPRDTALLEAALAAALDPTNRFVPNLPIVS